MRKSALVAGFVVALGLCAPSVAAAPEAQTSAPAAASVQAEGTFKFVVKLKVSGSLANAASIGVTATALAADPTFSNQTQLSATAALKGGQASATVLLPYIFVLESRAEQVTLNISVFGTRADGSIQYSDNSFLSQNIDLPKDGATTTVTFSGTI